MLRIVADLGNSRLKWGRLGPEGDVVASVALPTDDRSAWVDALARWQGDGSRASSWAVSSVNPPVADRLAEFVAGLPDSEARWFCSAADVPVRHELGNASSAGADRAMAVAATTYQKPSCRATLIVLCGTAITVERISPEGVWQGGAITMGLGSTSRALNLLTAQLPRVELHSAPPAWGNNTIPALEAGVFWGVVGAVRELLTRQSKDFEAVPVVIWSGGDASLLAPAVDWPGAVVVPDLVLKGLARVAFPREVG